MHKQVSSINVTMDDYVEMDVHSRIAGNNIFSLQDAEHEVVNVVQVKDWLVATTVSGWMIDLILK